MKKSHHQDKRLLKQQYDVLKKVKNTGNASWKSFYENTVMDPSKTIYEKYAKLYRTNGKQKDEIFDADKVGMLFY